MRTLQQFNNLNRPLQLLCLNQLAIMTGFTMLMPYLAGYLTTTLGLAVWLVGLVLGLRTFSQQGLGIIGGTLADHLGYRAVIIGGCGLRMSGFLLFACGETLPAIILAAFFTGFGGALFAPAVRAYLVSEAGERRVEAFALFQICEGLGACLGPVLGLTLFRVSFQLVCLVASGIFLVLTLLQLRYLPAHQALETRRVRPVWSEWREVLANRPLVRFAVGLVAYLTLYSQLYLSLPLEVRRLTGHDAGTGILLSLCALVSILAQVHVTAYSQARWRPLQAITMGLVCMGGAFLPVLAARPFLPLLTPQGTFADTATVSGVLLGALNLSPALASAMLLSLGIMIVQPFALSLIPTLSGNRLLGTSFGLYSLVQGSGSVVGNLLLGAAFDAGQSLGFASLPWLLMLGLGLVSALSIRRLDVWEQRAQALHAGAPAAPACPLVMGVARQQTDTLSGYECSGASTASGGR